MKTDFLIIPECFVDTILVEALVPPDNREGYNHQMGCNKVRPKSPAIETFLLKVAESVKINPNEFGIPNSLKELKSVTKKRTSKNNPNLKNFIKALKNKNTPQFVTLSNWISYLKENTFHSNLEEIKNIQ